MNKVTKSIKELKEQTTLHIGPPPECRVCGYDTDKMKEEFDIRWLEHRIPNTNFVFYVCPNCHVCSGNEHATENAKKIRENQVERPSKILTPQGKLVRPPGGFAYPPGTDKH